MVKIISLAESINLLMENKMKIFAISDLHLSNSCDKPMDIFGGNWEGYTDKIIENWKAKVSDDDIVLIAGDISWKAAADRLSTRVSARRMLMIFFMMYVSFPKKFLNSLCFGTGSTAQRIVVLLEGFRKTSFHACALRPLRIPAPPAGCRSRRVYTAVGPRSPWRAFRDRFCDRCW